MTLTDPSWLVLAIPLVMSLWLWPLPSRGLLGLRCTAQVLLLLALCGLSVLLPARSGTVVLVADRSLSMPPDTVALQREAADIVHAAMAADDKLAVVSFAETAAVEQSPQAGKFGGFSAEVGADASNLADALDKALSLIGKGEPGRILVLSDGQWTGRELSSAAAQAAAAGVAIDYRPMQRQAAGDLAIERIQAPESVMPGESFMITAWLDSPLGQSVSSDVLRGEQTIAQGTQDVPAGSSRLIFRDTTAAGGSHEYVLHVRGQGPDPVTENNRARLLVGIRGSRPTLCVSPGQTSGFADLLRRSGLKVELVAAAQCRWTLEELANYSAVVLENTPASLIGHVGLQNLSAWVAETGGGLMLTGGKGAYGLGGYHKSPLESILPVSMELRQEHRKLALAIVVAMDRSGSMAGRVPDGRAKIDLADLAAAEVVEMLGPLDQFGCLAIDSVPHEIVPLSDVVDKGAMRKNILRIDSGGNGIYIHEAIQTAGRMLRSAKAGVKHILLLADAADSRQHPGEYKTLAEECANAGITITVVGLGTEKDCDAELLKDVAQHGGGECLFTNVAQELPRLFVQDTLVIARSAFLDEPVAVRPTGGLTAIIQQPLGEFPVIGGYNLCYIRPGGTAAIVSEDEYTAPVLASWQAGLGRALCYTGEVDGKYTGPIAQWNNVGDFLTSLARWTAGRTQGLGSNIVATQELRNGVCRIELHLDPERESTPFARLPELTTLAARPGETAAAKKTRMSWASADTLLAEIPITGSETVLTAVEVPEVGQTMLAPMCLPYSPEFLPRKPERGVEALDELARSTGGSQRVNLGEIWKGIPKRPAFLSLSPYLLTVAVVIFLLEVAQRRTGFLSVRWKVAATSSLEVAKKIVGKAGHLVWRNRPATGQAAPQEPLPTATAMSPAMVKPLPAEKPSRFPALSQKEEREVKAATAIATPKQEKLETTPKQDKTEEGMFDALTRAQQRARQRTDRS